MENSNADNSTFNGTLDAASYSTPANVPRDGSTAENMVGTILSLIQDLQAAYQELGHRYCALVFANAGSGERMADVINSSIQTIVAEREGNLEEDDEALLGLLEYMRKVNAGLRVRAFYLSIKLHKYELAKSTCPESKEQCCICLDEYCDGEELAEIDCGHVYHVDCIKEWVKLKNSCPICKRDALAILT